MDLDTSREFTTALVSFGGTVENENLLFMLILSAILIILGCFSYFLIALNMGSFMCCGSVIYVSLISISKLVAAETKNSLNTSAISEFSEIIIFPFINDILWDVLIFSEKVV